MRYCVVQAHRIDGLASSVNDRLQNGWELHGSLAVCCVDSGIVLYSQAMVTHDVIGKVPSMNPDEVNETSKGQRDE